MSLSRDTRVERKLKAVRRAEKRLQQRLDYIDWEEDVLIPEVTALKAGGSVLGLPSGVAFDIRIVDASKTVETTAVPEQASDANSHHPPSGQ